MIPIMIEDLIEITGPQKEEGPKVIMEDHLREKGTKVEEIMEEIMQVEMGTP